MTIGAGRGWALLRAWVAERVGHRASGTPDGPRPASTGGDPIPIPALPRRGRLRIPGGPGRRTGSSGSRRTGSGIEAATVRPWVEGDPARSIDWRVTARMQDPWVRVHHDDREHPVHLLTTLSPSASDLRSLDGATEWIRRAATAAGHPVHRPPPAASVADLAATLDRGGFDGLVVLLSDFDAGPDAFERLDRAIRRLRSAATVLLVRVGGPPAELPRAGVIRVRDGAGRTRRVDTSDPQVRERWQAGRAAWCEAIARLGGGVERIDLEADDPGLAPLVRAFTARRRARSAVAGLAALIAAVGAAAAPAVAQEVLGDRMPATVPLGGELVRTVELRWAEGPGALPAPVHGEEIDVRVRSMVPLASAVGDAWRLEVVYRPWTLGERVLPLVSITDARGTGALELRPRRVRVVPPPAPVSGLAPTVPRVHRRSPVRVLLHLPTALGIAAILSTGVGVARVLVRRAGAGGVPGSAGLRPAVRPARPNRTELDRLVAELRDGLDRRAGHHPGWTGRRWAGWARAHLDPALASQVDALRVAVDERRFRPDPPTADEIDGADVAVRRFLREVGS